MQEKAFELHHEEMKEYVEALKNKYNTEFFLRLIGLCRSSENREVLERRIKGTLEVIPEDNLFLRNVLVNELEILQKKTALTSKIRSFTVTLTNRCNLNCRMCDAKSYPWEIPQKIAEEIVEYFPYLEYIMFQGGEVFLTDFFIDMLEKARHYPQMKQLIVTNGLLLSEDLIRRLMGQPELVLAISIDGVTKDVYEKIRTGGKFAKLKENIEILNSMRGKGSSSIRLHLNATIMKSNCHQLMDFIEFAKKYQFDSVLFRPVQGNYDSDENIFFRKDKDILDYINKVLVKVEHKAEEYRIHLDNRISSSTSQEEEQNSKKDEKNGNNLLCYAPWQRLYIAWGGNVYPDCMCVYPPDIGIGNVAENSIQEIWNNQGMQMYRRKLIEGNYLNLCNQDCTASLVPKRYMKFNK